MKVGSKIRCSESGNGPLEMLVFLPLAMFFLFLVVDGGMAYVDRSTIVDALRAGLNSQGIYEAGTVQELGDGSAIEIVDFAAEGLVTSVGQEIESILNRRFSSEDYQLTITAMQIAVDPQTGETIGFPIEIASFRAGEFRVGSKAPKFQATSRGEFLASELARDSMPSRYALRSGARYTVFGEYTDGQFLDRGIILYGEVIGMTRGFARQYVKRILGRYFVVQTQLAEPLRVQLN